MNLPHSGDTLPVSGRAGLTPERPPRPVPDLLAGTPVFARVFRHSPVGITISDTTEGHFVAANDAFCRMVGISAARLIGYRPDELGLMAAASHDATLHFLRDTGTMRDMPIQLIGRDGELRSLVASIQRLKLDGGDYLVTMLQDLSEYARLRRALAESDTRFRMFFENAPLALIVSDEATGAVIDVNPVACEQYGYSRAQFLALPPHSLQVATATVAGKRVLERHRTSDGSELVVEVTSFHFDLDGRPVRLDSYLDVTAQVRNEQALADSERRLRIVSDVSNDGLWDWDLIHDVVWRNKGPLFSGPDEEAPPWTWTERHHPQDESLNQAGFLEAVAAHEPQWKVEYRARRPDGSWANVLQRGVILYEDGRPVRAIGATVDITDQIRLAEAESQAALAERERLARDLHDSVTQSLFSVSLLAEAARRHAQTGDQKATTEFTTRLGDLAQQALRQMRLLVYELRPTVLDQEGLLGALRHRLESVEMRAGVKAELVVRGERLLTSYQQSELFWVAHEALNNALKHAEASVVTVRVDTRGKDTIVEVIDNGRGFDPAGQKEGEGLRTMRERSARVQAQLTLVSEIGAGTIVRLSLPG